MVFSYQWVSAAGYVVLIPFSITVFLYWGMSTFYTFHLGPSLQVTAVLCFLLTWVKIKKSLSSRLLHNTKPVCASSDEMCNPRVDKALKIAFEPLTEFLACGWFTVTPTLVHGTSHTVVFKARAEQLLQKKRQKGFLCRVMFVGTVCCKWY